MRHLQLSENDHREAREASTSVLGCAEISCDRSQAPKRIKKSRQSPELPADDRIDELQIHTPIIALNIHYIQCQGRALGSELLKPTELLRWNDEDMELLEESLTTSMLMSCFALRLARSEPITSRLHNVETIR